MNLLNWQKVLANMPERGCDKLAAVVSEIVGPKEVKIING